MISINPWTQPLPLQGGSFNVATYLRKKKLMTEENITVKFKSLHDKFVLPTQATDGSAGFDMRACIDNLECFPEVIPPGQVKLILLGCSVEIPVGYEIQVRPRSGLALKNRITVLNSPGTIDSDYRGPCGVILINHGPDPFLINQGDRVCQFVVQKVPVVKLELVEELSDTDRGAGGFGSTGVK